MTSPGHQERDALERRPMANIRAALPDLQKQLRGVSDHWGYKGGPTVEGFIPPTRAVAASRDR